MKTMKFLRTVVALALFCALAIFSLSACSLQLGGSDTSGGTDGSGGTVPLTEYTVSFNSDGGSAVASVKAQEGKKISAPASPTKKDYVFAGWYNGETLWVFSENAVSANITLKAKWVAATDSSVVNFNSDGGSIVPSQIISASGKITAPTAPTKAGYSFLGWYDGQTAWNFGSSVADGNITLTAKWQIIDYVIDYELGENAVGAEGNPTSYTVHDDAKAIGAPTREGFVFTGWTYGDVTTPTLSVTVGGGEIGNISLVANWEAAPEFATYKINYVLDGGKNAASNPATYTEGADVITLAAPTRNYYNFIGWTYEGADAPVMNVTIDPTVDSGDKTYTAIWQEIVYSIKYVLSGGEHLGNPTTYTASDLPLSIKPAIKANTHFFGWYSDADYTIPSSTIGACSDITLYAKFIDTSEGVVYELNESGTGYIVKGYTGTGGHVYIASIYNRLPVLEIADKAFFGEAIPGVTIPEGIVKIGNLAFGNCEILSKVEIASSIEFIGADAFKNCPITDVTVENGINYIGNSNNPYVVAMKSESYISGGVVLNENTKIIYSYTFDGAAKVTSIVLPEGLKMLCDYALAGLSGITELSLPDSLKYVGSSAFHGCTALNYNVEGGIRYLGNESNPYMVIVKAQKPAAGETLSVDITEATKIICGYAFTDISTANIIFECDKSAIYIHAIGNDILFAEPEEPAE